MGIDLTGWAAKLFDDVCAFIGGDNAFPPDEPEDARALGQAWGRLADKLEAAVTSTNQSAEKIFADWTDSAGHNYLTLIKSYNTDLSGLVTSCREMAKFCEQYARDIHQQRMATRIEMIINAASFALAFTGGGAALAGIFARRVAANVLKRMLMAAARTAASAESRSAVRTIALDVGKEIAIEAGEEAVISAGSQLASQAAGYNPGGINTKQLATDTLAGGIGGALGFGPGKLVGAVKPRGVVGQHLSAAATGAGLNAVTSPVASVAAHDVVNGGFSGLDAYGKAVQENGLDAARMGGFRANGTVLAGQLGSAATHTNADIGLGPTGPDGPPPNNTPAAPEVSGTAGATEGGPADADGQGTSGAEATANSAEGQGTAGNAPDGAGATGATASGKGAASGATSSGSGAAGQEGVRSTMDESATPGSEAENGSNDQARQEGATGEPGAREQSVEGGAAEDSAAGSTTDNHSAGSPPAAESGTAGQTGPATTASPATADPATGATVAATMTGLAGTGATGAGSAVAGSATSGKAGRDGKRADVSAAETLEPATPVATESTQEQTSTGPVEIAPEVWQTLSQPVRDAVNRLFEQKTTSQSVKNTVARLAGLGLAEKSKQDIIELAGTTMLAAVVDIAARAPDSPALEVAIRLAGQKLSASNTAIRKIRDLAGRNAADLDTFLAEFGESPSGGASAQPNKPASAAKAEATQGLGPGLVEAPARQPLLPVRRVATSERTAKIDAIARASLRDAERLAGVSSVTSSNGDSRVYRVTDSDGYTFDATVQAADLGGTVAATYLTDGQAVRIIVSSRTAPAAVPALVAAALVEAAVELSGRGTAQADFLVQDSSGDPVLSRRDLGRAAQLLANGNLLRRSPLRLTVRAQLTALIREMGLAPDQDGAASRLAALPDERMREVVRRHTTELDGLPGTLLYLAKNMGTAVPTSVMLAVAATVAGAGTPVIAAMVATSLARALVQSLYDRPTAVRETAAADEQLAERKRQLKDQAKAELGGAFLQAVAQLKAAGTEQEPKGPKPVTAQLARIYGLRRNAGALGALTALGVVAALGATPVLGALSPLAAFGIFTGTVAPALVGPVLDAAKKRYTMDLKAARNNALLTKVNDLVVARRHEIAAHANKFAELVGDRLAHEFGESLAGAPEVRARKFWYGDNVATQLAGNLVPRTRESNDKDRAQDPNGLAAFLHLWAEYGGFRAANAAATVAVNLVFGGTQHIAEQDAAFARKQYDSLREADRDVASFAVGLADILGQTVPEFASPDENTPLAQDPDRPAGVPSAKWLLVGVVAGALAAGIAFGMHALLGMNGIVSFALGGAAAPVADAYASRKLSVKEQGLGDKKAELDRAAAQGERDKLAAALAEFGQHLQHDTEPAPSQVTGTDPVVDRILADRDQAYRDLLNEARQPLGKLAETIVDRLVALNDIAAKTGKLATIRAEHGQTRPEAVARNQLIAAIQKYNRVPGVTKLSMSGLLDGVHAGNAGQDRLHEAIPNLPVPPADVTGQAAAVTVDRHLQDPGSLYEVPEDLVAWAGNEGWADRVAAAAGVPGGQFQPVAATNDIVARLRQLGEGSRAIVHARRKDVATDDIRSGDLVNAVNIGGDVYFVNGVTGAPADLTEYADGLSMLITQDNGEQTRALAGRRVTTAVTTAAGRMRGAYQDLVPGSLLTDPAAPGLPGRAEETSLADGLTRIASVINPDQYLPERANPKLDNDMPVIHAFSDQWDYEEWPAPETEKLVAGLGVAQATAGLAVAMLDTFGGDGATRMVEYQRLTDLLRQENIQPAELFDAMTALMEALLG